MTKKIQKYILDVEGNETPFYTDEYSAMLDEIDQTAKEKMWGPLDKFAKFAMKNSNKISWGMIFRIVHTSNFIDFVATEEERARELISPGELYDEAYGDL